MTIEVKMNATQYPAGIVSGLVRESGPDNTNKVDEKSATELDKKLAETDDKKEQADSESISEMVDKAVTSLNSSIQSVQRNLQFSVDKDLDKIVINVTDKETDEVVRQIPSEEVLDLARNLQDMVENRNNSAKSTNEGIFFSSTA
ncbi:MAG: flagellar protein FlaG [Pseudomonadota bacterium]